MELQSEQFPQDEGVRLRDIIGLIPTEHVVPTYTPAKFDQQFRIVANGGSSAAYVYDSVNNRWAGPASLPTTTNGDIIIHNGTQNIRASLRDYVPTTYGGVGTYVTQVLPVDTNFGWTSNGTLTKGANYFDIDNNTAAWVNGALKGPATGVDGTIAFNSGIDLRVSYLFSNVKLSTGTGPGLGSGDIWYSHGFGESSGVHAEGHGDISGGDVQAFIGFAHYNGRLYAVTKDGVSAMTATDIQADAADSKKHYTIDYTPTSVIFYINGVLVATHTTSIPATAANIYLDFAGAANGGVGDCSFAMSHTITFSETLS